MLILFLVTLPREAEDVKYKQMALADALRAKVALVLLSLGFPQNLVWQFPLSCQIFGALTLIYYIFLWFTQCFSLFSVGSSNRAE